MPLERRSPAPAPKRPPPRSTLRIEALRRAQAAEDVYRALFDLVALIASEQLIPESVGYMRAGRAALAKWVAASERPAPTCVGKSHVWRENRAGAVCDCGAARL